MAEVTIYTSVVRMQTQQVAERVIGELLREIELAAKAATAAGPYTSGDLSASITRTPVTVRGEVITGSVGSSLWYAKFSHDGTRKHFIFPRGNYKLRFYWRRVGREVAFWSVYHPGQKAKKWLTGPASVIAARHGWIVYTRNI